MNASPRLSIVIVTHRTADVLRDCLASLAQQRRPEDEVIVVDNASGDGTPAMVKAEFPWVKLIESPENLGFSPANNLALAQAKGELLLLLNPDTVVPAGALADWVEQHRAKPAGLSGPRLLYPDGTFQVSAWRTPGLLNSVLELFYLHRISGIGRYPRARFDADHRPDFVSGAALLFGRELYARIGGLDPEMFWMEDVDLCTRAREAGASVWYLAGPTIVHIGGQSAKRNMDRVISNQLISRIKYMRKHGNALSTALLVVVVFLHVVSRIVAFGLVRLFRPEPRAHAYVYTLRKLGRYLFRGDRSI